jgi:hypothetical protein
MLSELTQKEPLCRILHSIDEDLAEKKKATPCPFCGDRLHQSNYERKPRGGPKVPDKYCLRHSLCCRECRRRVLPPSARFMGRKVYWGGVILTVLALRDNRMGSMSMRRLMKLFSVSLKTVMRWVSYFREVFPLSGAWKALRGLLPSQVRNDHLPEDLVHYQITVHGSEKGLVNSLVFLSGRYIVVSNKSR